MKRIAILLAAVVGVAAGADVAVAASSSPTASTHNATAIGTTSAVLRGAVNPNGHETGFGFQYGLTKVLYGVNATGHALGAGKKPVAVAVVVHDLTPGTVYHFRITALSSAGGAFGGDQVFKTKGHPPASVVTGPAVGVGKSEATVTGSINPEGEATTWAVQYGLSTTYTSQTIGQTPLLGVAAPMPVAVQLAGLAPGKLYHYRIVAKHPASVSYGLDATFFTLPSFRRKPNMTTRTSPSHARRKPYVFTTAGTLHGANFVPASLRCTGRVGIRYYNDRHQVAFVLTPVGADCKFSTPVSFRRLINGGPTPLSVKITYRGNGYLRSVEKTNHVTLG